MKQLLLIYSLLSVSISVSGQTATECISALEAAETAFEQGRLLYILDKTLNNQFYSCLEEGNFSIEQKIRARKLLVKANLFSDNEEEAESKLVDLLVLDKEHQLKKEDPAELHFLYKKFKTEPIFRLAMKLGINRPLISKSEEFNTFQYGTKDYGSSNAAPSLLDNFNIEILMEKHLFKGVEVGLGPQIRFLAYGVEVKPNNPSRVLTYVAINRSTMLRLPVFIRYNRNYSALNKEGARVKLIPYVYLGASFDYTLNAEYINTNRSGGIPVTLQPESRSLTDRDQVSRQNISIFGGIGAKFRLGRTQVNFLTVELRYENALFNYINPDGRWNNRNSIWDVMHVEDDLTINAISVSIGYTRSFYIPRKRKEFR